MATEDWENGVPALKQRTMNPRPNAIVPLAACAIAFAAFWAIFPPAIPLLQPDSAGYLVGQTTRGRVYFLVVTSLGEPSRVVPLQLSTYFLAATILAWELGRATENILSGFCFLILVGANRFLVENCFTVLPEAPTMALSMLALVVLARFITSPRLATGLVLTFIGGLLADLRPATLGFGLLVLALALFTRGRRWPTFLAGCALLCIPAIVSVMRPSEAMFERRAFLALTLSGKHALLGQADASSPALARALADSAAEMRARINKIASPFAAYEVRMIYAEHLRYRVWPELVEQMDASPDQAMAAVVALAAANPYAWIAQVARDLAAFWLRPDILTVSEGNARARELERSYDPSLRDIEPGASGGSSVRVWFARAVLATGFLLSLVALSAGGLRITRPWIFLGWSGAVYVWSVFGVYAVLHGAVPRYAFSAWPQVSALAAIAFGLAISRLSAMLKRTPNFA